MAQGVLPYKYEEEKTEAGMTALAGLPVYLDLASVLGLGDHIRTHLQVKSQGWTDEQIDPLPCAAQPRGGRFRRRPQDSRKDEAFARSQPRGDEGIVPPAAEGPGTTVEKGTASLRSFPFRHLPVPRSLP